MGFIGRGAPIIRADYDGLKKIQQEFIRESEQTAELTRRVHGLVEQLAGGGWIGVGAEAFFREMAELVFPGLERLVKSLGEASHATARIHDALAEAEGEAASLFGGNGSGANGILIGSGGGAGAGSGGPGGLFGGGGSASGIAGGSGSGGILDAIKDYFSGAKTASDSVTLVKNLLEKYGKNVPKLGVFSALFSGAIDTWEQLNKGRSLGDAVGIAGSKWALETALFSTPQGKVVEIVNDAGQLAWKVIPGATDYAFDKLGASDGAKSLISQAGKNYADNIGNLDIKNVTRDAAATLWDGMRFQQSLFFGNGDVSTTGKQFLNSTGDLAATVGKFSGAMWKGPDAAWDYGGAAAGGLLSSGVNALPVSNEFKSNFNSGVQNAVEIWRDIPSPTKAVGEGYEWLGGKYQSGLKWLGESTFD